MSWRADFRADLARYEPSEWPLLGDGGKPPSPLLMVASRRELWALLHYRMTRGLRQSHLPEPLTRRGLLLMGALRRPIEACSGITLPDTAVVGPGLRFAHPGLIVVNGEAVIGRDCTVNHGVTIGASAAGVAVIGDGVYIGTNAVIAGDVHVGDRAKISANSLVIRDVPPGALARGVPAEIVERSSGQPAGGEG
jgi:serine O-acetyltransferase